jgi:hypothetical protein
MARYTLKRFADLALAQAHEARATQLLSISISRGEDLPSLTPYNLYNARLAPLATLGEGADLPQILRSQDPLYDYLVEFNLERYTINRQRTELRAQPAQKSEKNTKIGNQRDSETKTRIERRHCGRRWGVGDRGVP